MPCTLCHGEGNLTWTPWGNHPPGTPAQVLVPCPRCASKGYLEQERPDSGRPEHQHRAAG